MTNSPSNPAQKKFNVLVVGPNYSGKTSLLNVLTTGRMYDQENELDSVFVAYTKGMSYNGRHVELSIQDTQSEVDYLFHRTPLYEEAHLIIVTFSIGCRASYNEAFTTWLKEVHQNNVNKAPIMFVGCKADLFSDEKIQERNRISGTSTLTMNEIRSRMKSLWDNHYVACSSKTGMGVDRVLLQSLKLLHARSCPDLATQILQSPPTSTPHCNYAGRHYNFQLRQPPLSHSSPTLTNRGTNTQPPPATSQPSLVGPVFSNILKAMRVLM